MESVESVLALDLRPPPVRLGPKVRFHRHDVTQPLDGLLERHAVDTVVHLAFVMSPDRDRAASLPVNVGGMERVLEAAEREGVRHLLYLSSTTVYGAHADNPKLLTEESPPRPLPGFAYSEDKLRAEAMLRDLTMQRTDISACVLRACPVVGPGNPGPLGRALSKPVAVTVRGHDPPMQLLHEDDLVDVIVRCVLDRVSGLYNVAGFGGVRWSDVARLSGRVRVALPAPALYALAGAAWLLRLQDDSPRGLDLIRYPWNVSTEKIRRDLGVRLRYSSWDAWRTYADGVLRHEASTVRG